MLFNYNKNLFLLCELHLLLLWLVFLCSKAIQLSGWFRCC